MQRNPSGYQHKTRTHSLTQVITHFLPKIPLNLFFPSLSLAPAPAPGPALTTLRLPIPPPLAAAAAASAASARPSNRSQGATSAFRGVAPVAIASRCEGGSGQSIVDATLGARLGGRLLAWRCVE